MFLRSVLFSIILVVIAQVGFAKNFTVLSPKTQAKGSRGSASQVSSSLSSIIRIVESSFTVKLPGRAAGFANSLLVSSSERTGEIAVVQNYLEGPQKINDFAFRVSKAITDGNRAAGLSDRLDLAAAQKVIVGLTTALLLIQTEQVPSCEVRPLKVGQNYVKGCHVSERSTGALDTYFVNKNIQGYNQKLYFAARQLMFAMISGAGLIEYEKSLAHREQSKLAYESLWIAFLEKVNSQGSDPKPVIAFIEAFKELQIQQYGVGVRTDHQHLQAMNTFFGACATRVGI